MRSYYSIVTADQQPNTFQTNLPSLHPGAQGDFERPGRAVLPVEVKISLRDAVGVGKIVVDIGAYEAVRTGAVLLPPADRCIDWNLSNVNSLRHKFPC